MMHPRSTALPVALMRRLAAALLGVLLRVRVSGLEHLRAAGPRTLLIANHLSLIDGLLLFVFLPVNPVFAVSPSTARCR